jgi:S-adenosylmethionine-diacylglycerol 3-amino-3-carboxypropyl transferase
MNRFFSTLNYSSSNEDSRSEHRALRLINSDKVVTVTGSGGRTLDLLTAQPGKIYSVDMNPAQSYLLELKLAGVRNLTYEEFLGFVGVTPSSSRIAYYKSCRAHLSLDAANYWDNNLALLKAGVIYQGRWEKYFRLLAWMVQSLRRNTLARIFSADSLEEQEELYRRTWDGPLWRSFLRAISTRFVWKNVFGDPGFFQHVPREFSVSDYLISQFDAAFRTRPIRQSAFMTLLLRGRFSGEALPLHLQREHFPTLKQSWDRVSIATAPLGCFLLEQPEHSIHAFSLSDISSYTDTAQYYEIWQTVLRAAAPGARVCERQFLVKRTPPEITLPRLTRSPQLEKRLDKEDDSAFYTFVVGTLR